jgi:hypothetical protein
MQLRDYERNTDIQNLQAELQEVIEAAETFEHESQSRQQEINQLREYISVSTNNETSLAHHCQSTESGQVV